MSEDTKDIKGMNNRVSNKFWLVSCENTFHECLAIKAFGRAYKAFWELKFFLTD